MKPTTPITYQPYLGVQPYVTKDRSTIRELMCPARHGNQAQSLAEAIIPAGGRTLLHRHLTSEEIYYIVRGDGMMTLDGKAFFVKAGDTICIPPGTPHAIKAGTRERLRILCACSPAYSHDDTELLEAEPVVVPQAPKRVPAPAPVAAVTPPAKPVAPQPAPAPAPVAKPTPAPLPAAVPAKEDPKVAAKPKDDTPAQAAAISKAVQSWAGAWSRKDVKAYLSHYGREFEPPKGLNRKAWEEERNQRLTKPGDIEVNLENVKVVSVTGDRATVKLRQHYRSANLSTSSNKTLNLMLQDGKWVIVQERVGG